MNWTMPPETAPQDRVWMAFPREGRTLGATAADREAGYAAWSAVAKAVARFEPVTMIVDPTEITRARAMLGSSIEIVERPIGEFWLRDSGPTFVQNPDGRTGAVDWIFNGWGGHDWSDAGARPGSGAVRRRRRRRSGHPVAAGERRRRHPCRRRRHACF